MDRDDTADAVEILRRRSDELRPAHEEYLRLTRALAALSPPTNVAGIEVDGEIGSLVLAAMSPNEEVSPAVVRSRLIERGEVIRGDQVSNAINYLARSGRIRRLGRGRYRLEQEGPR